MSIFMHMRCVDKTVLTTLRRMGSSQSFPGLTQDLLEDYTNLTYLCKGEILHLMSKFYSIDPEKVKADYNHRFGKQQIVNKFPVLKNNPFRDRLFHVFSSQDDGRLSFEDLLDLCSVMSADCPLDVKAEWAFRIYDLDDDNQISAKDICNILDRLTWDPFNRNNFLDNAEKDKIAKIILHELALDITGSIGLSEFKIMMSRIPEFTSSFYFKL